MATDETYPDGGEEPEGTAPKVNTNSMEAGCSTLNGTHFSDYTMFRTTASSIFTGTWDDMDAYAGEVLLQVDVGAMELEASMSPDEARELAKYLLDRADRSERQAERRSQQLEIAQEDSEE